MTLSNPETRTYLVAGNRPWNRHVFDQTLRKLPGEWHFISDRGELTEALRKLSPRFVFFLHWSWKVPEEVTGGVECIGFHMTDVPYRRGGTPLQNLIVRGHRDTVLTALRYTTEIDAGPVYLKEPLSLDGSAEEIYSRATEQAAAMIERIVLEKLEPVPQQGEAVVFERRTPAESEIPAAASLDRIYDHIRMLDAEGYPRAFIDWRGFRYEFSKAVQRDGRVKAEVTITPSREAD